jgi:uncharacterized membrane protein
MALIGMADNSKCAWYGLLPSFSMLFSVFSFPTLTAIISSRIAMLVSPVTLRSVVVVASVVDSEAAVSVVAVSEVEEASGEASGEVMLALVESAHSTTRISTRRTQGLTKLWRELLRVQYPACLLPLPLLLLVALLALPALMEASALVMMLNPVSKSWSAM